MASYIQGLTDYIPQVERFKPDLNLYGTVLQAKQSKYDAAKKKLGSLYGSLLYAPLTHDSNIERRDGFFKMIEQDVKKISGMDLSLPQNVDAASNIFQPLIDDPYISYDMGYTKKANNEIERGMSYKNCVDPAKCNGEFWQEGITAIQMKLQDFAKANIEDTLKMAPPSFTPFINVTKKAIDYATTLGLNVTNVSSDGKYLVTVKNGKQLLVPLQYLYSAVFGKDPAIKSMYDTQSYLSRKNYIFQNKGKFNGDENLAEEEYFKTVLDTTGQTLKDDITNVKTLARNASVQRRAIENKIKRDGVTMNPDDPYYKLYVNTVGDDEAAKTTESYYDQVENQFSKMSNNSQDREILRSQIDGMVGTGLLNDDIGKAAIAYSATHSEISKVADPYAMKMFEHQLNLESKWAETGMSIVKEKILMDMEYGMFNMMNGTYNQAGGIPMGPGAGSSTAAGAVDHLADERAMIQNYYKQNLGQRSVTQKNYLQTITDSAREIINDSGSSPEEKMAAKNTLQTIFKDRFDMETGMFKTPEGTLTNYWTQAVPDADSLNKFFEAAKTNIKGSAILNGVYVTQLQPMENEMQRYADREKASISLWSNNNKATLNAGLVSPDVDDKNAYKTLFKTLGNGNMIPKGKIEYVDDYLKSVNWGSNVSETKKRERAGDAYDEAFSMYKTLYNNGSAKTGMNHVRTLLNTVQDDGGVTSNRVGFTIDAGRPGTVQPFLSFWQSAQTPAFLKAVAGDDQGNKGGAYDKADNDSNAMDMFNQFAYDTMNKRYKKGSTEARPAGVMIYEDVAANKGDAVALTLRPDPTWMETHATGSKAKGDETAFGLPREDWDKGVTVYLKKSETNNALTSQYARQPDEVIFAANQPYNISTPLAGKATIKRNPNGTVNMTGEFKGLKTNPETGKLDWYTRTAESTVPAGGRGAIDIARDTEYYLNEINKSNYKYLVTGVGETRIKDPNQLMQSVMQNGGSDNMEFIMQMRQIFGF